MFYVYILKCADGSYYTGMTEDLEQRLAQHTSGSFEDSYTKSRRPVQLIWSQSFTHHDDAFRRERQIKGWSRAKKEALIRSDWDKLHQIVRSEFDAEQITRSKKSDES